MAAAAAAKSGIGISSSSIWRSSIKAAAAWRKINNGEKA